MAIAGLRAKVFSRAIGASAVAKAAYRAREHILDERTGDRHDYTRHRGKCLFEGIYAPKDAPEWAHDRAQLWNHVEAFEKHKRAELAREVQIDLPHELTLEQNRYLLQDWVKENATRKGLIADVAIHPPSRGGDQRNIHAHVLIVMRPLDGTEFRRNKDRFDSYAAKQEHWKAELMKERQSWQKLANRHLERHGHEARIDMGRLEGREPTVHLGWQATEMERRGMASELGDLNRGAANENEKRRLLEKLDERIAFHKAAETERKQAKERETEKEADFLAWEAAQAPVPPSLEREADPAPPPPAPVVAPAVRLWRGLELNYEILPEAPQEARKRHLDEPKRATGRTMPVPPQPIHAPEIDHGEAFQPPPAPAPDFWRELAGTLEPKPDIARQLSDSAAYRAEIKESRERSQERPAGRAPAIQMQEPAPSPLRVGRFLGMAIDALYRTIGTAADALGSLFESKPEAKHTPAPAPQPARAKEPDRAPQPEKSPTDLFLEEFERTHQHRPAAPEPPQPTRTHEHEHRMEFGPRPPGSRKPQP